MVTYHYCVGTVRTLRLNSLRCWTKKLRRYNINFISNTKKEMLLTLLCFHRVLIFMKSQTLMKEPDKLLRDCDYSRQYYYSWSFKLSNLRHTPIEL